MNCLFEDSAGVLWIGTSKGLAFFKSGRVQVPRDIPDSLREEAFGMSEDKEGWLWIATSDHVLRVSNQKLSSGVLSSAEICEFGGRRRPAKRQGREEKQISGSRIRREESGFRRAVACRL